MAAVDLGDFIEVLQREVNPPGRTIFAAAVDEDWIGYLSDAFWEARLDGFLSAWTASEDGLVTANDGSDTSFPRQLTALVVLYAGIRILRNQIMNTNTSFTAKAGAVEFERQNSATMLAEMLKQLAATKERLVAQIQEQTPTYAFDVTLERVFSAISHRGYYELT